MSKSEGAVTSSSGWWTQALAELVKTDVYKRTQGRIVRQATCIAIWAAFAVGAYQAYHFLLSNQVQSVVANMFGERATQPIAYAVPIVMLAVGVWFGYRLVNLPTFADFLIAVEAEMNKVSWPSKLELYRASLVVILLMFGLTIVLFGYDVSLAWVLKHILGVTQ
jgi:preprotein translocase subunit SecE